MTEKNPFDQRPKIPFSKAAFDLYVDLIRDPNLFLKLRQQCHDDPIKGEDLFKSLAEERRYEPNLDITPNNLEEILMSATNRVSYLSTIKPRRYRPRWPRKMRW